MRAWFVRLYGEIVKRICAQTMLYLACTMISSVDLAHYGVSRAKDWVSVDCGTKTSTRRNSRIRKHNYWSEKFENTE